MKKKKAGRPPLAESQKRKSLTIRLDPDTYKKLTKAVGNGKKTEFVELAIVELMAAGFYNKIEDFDNGKRCE